MSSFYLESTGDTILEGDEKLGRLCLHKGGGIGVEHDALKRIIGQLVIASNSQFATLTGAENGLYAVTSEVQAVKQTVEEHGVSISEVQNSLRELKVLLNTVKVKQDEDRQEREKHHQVAKQFATHQELAVCRQSAEQVVRRLAETEMSHREAMTQLDRRAGECENQLKQHQEAIDEDIPCRFNNVDDTLVALKRDLEGQQAGLGALQGDKADTALVEAMEGEIGGILVRLEEALGTLKEARANLQKLDGCVVLAEANKDRSEEIWRTFREETLESREWASRLFHEVKTDLLRKIDQAAASHLIDELRGEVRSSSAALHASAKHVMANFRHKAEASDVLRLRERVQQLGGPEPEVPPVVAISRCLVCSHELSQREERASSVERLRSPDRARYSPSRSPEVPEHGFYASGGWSSGAEKSRASSPHRGFLPPAFAARRAGLHSRGKQSASDGFSPRRAEMHEPSKLVHVSPRSTFQAATPAAKRPQGPQLSMRQALGFRPGHKAAHNSRTEDDPHEGASMELSRDDWSASSEAAGASRTFG